MCVYIFTPIYKCIYIHIKMHAIPVLQEYIVQCTVCIVQCTLYIDLYTKLYISDSHMLFIFIQGISKWYVWIKANLQCTMHTVHYILYIVHCTMCIVHYNCIVYYIYTVHYSISSIYIWIYCILYVEYVVYIYVVNTNVLYTLFDSYYLLNSETVSLKTMYLEYNILE